MTTRLAQLGIYLQKNLTLLDQQLPDLLNIISNIDELNLPYDIPGSDYDPKHKKGTKPKKEDIQRFYEDLGMPFYHSLTKKQITKLRREMYGDSEDEIKRSTISKAIEKNDVRVYVNKRDQITWAVCIKPVFGLKG